MWGLWKQRNEAFFQGQGVSLSIIAEMAVKLAEESRILVCPDHLSADWACRSGVCFILKKSIYVIRQVLGKLSSTLMVPVFSGDAGFILRNTASGALIARNFPILGILVPIAELLVAEKGLVCLVWTLSNSYLDGGTRPCCALDDLGMLKWICRGYGIGGYSGALVGNVLEWLLLHENHRRTYIPCDVRTKWVSLATGGSMNTTY